MTYNSIFQVKVDGVFYTTPHSYTEPEFEAVMNLVAWRMPFGMHAYHYHQSDADGKGMAIIKQRPVLDLDVRQLFEHGCKGQMNMMARESGTRKQVTNKLAQHLLVQADDDEYARYTLFDPQVYWLNVNYGVVPLPFRTAKEFVNCHHRHNVAPPGHKFSIGLKAAGDLIGVVIASVPKAKTRDDGYTLEINRCCVMPGYRNACSKLMGHAIRAGAEMGYMKFISYTKVEEPGSSLRAAGFSIIGVTKPTANGWSSPSRPRKKPIRYPEGPKNVWIREIAKKTDVGTA